MRPDNLIQHDDNLSWTHLVTVGIAPSIFIAPPIWFGYAGYGVSAVIGFGILVTVFAILLARIDGMRFSVSSREIGNFALVDMQITTVLMILYLGGSVAAQ